MRKLIVVTLCALAVAGCSGGTAGRPPLQLPEASAFKPGTCATIADPVRALGTFTYERADAAALSQQDRAKLVVEGEKLVAARETAEPELAEQMSQVLMAIGFVRIRIGDTYQPALLADVEAARQKLQSTCTV